MEKVKSLKKIFIAITLFWVFVLSFIFIKNILMHFSHIDELAINTARSALAKDKMFREWAASHGGLYARIDERTPPNPNLAHLPNRDIFYKDINLTLMNPAYMLRQMMNEYEGLYGTKGHITSLKLLNPNNAPDEWEKKALLLFEEGKTEYFEFSEDKNGKKLRLMRPLMTKESCLKCHRHQGYKVGDVRGGVSVTVPMKMYYEMNQDQIYMQIFSYLILTTLSFIIFYAAYTRLRNEIIKNEEQQKLLFQQSKNAAMGEMVNAIAHQWKQPVGIISQIIQEYQDAREFDDLDLDHMDKDSKTVMEQCDYMSKTIDDFRNFFKSSKEMKDFDIKTGIEKALKIMNHLIKRNNVDIQISDGSATVYGVENEFKQAIINIISNANDALVENREENRKILIDILKDDEKATVRIRDNAGGIDEENLKKIFSSSFSTKGENGTGIGLFMTKMIIEESFQGTIRAFNDDEGAVFEIMLFKS